jgi:hypothetical protein
VRRCFSDTTPGRKARVLAAAVCGGEAVADAEDALPAAEDGAVLTGMDEDADADEEEEEEVVVVV